MDNVQYTNGYYSHKNIFRLFYSLESTIQEKRNYIVPNAMPIQEAVQNLLEYQKEGEFPVILHHLILDNLNDSEEDLNHLIDFVNLYFPNNELRILRYNLCAKSPYKESEKFIAQIKKISDNIQFLKIQVSPGEEVSAACGQFIVKDFIRIQS